ncbi:MAG: hypothetical protein IKG22_11390 [Atopobiaceae bacterium]|nr:hypothetical protein [Atopobiaceae bacterium]
MFTFQANGKNYEAKATFYTAYIYEMEFRSDLIRDLFGVQTAEQALEIERTGDGEDDYRIVKIDFTKVNWTVVAKALWAAVKTADPSTPSYSEWMKKTAGVNLWLVQEELGNEISECFFRPEAAREEA